MVHLRLIQTSATVMVEYQVVGMVLTALSGWKQGLRK